MKSFTVRNVSEAIVVVGSDIKASGMVSTSRNGSVLEFQTPISVTYTKPSEMVLFHPDRNDNPLMNFFDSLFMFTEDSSPEFLKQFAPSFGNFANNGILRGDYGHRILNHFGYNQLDFVVEKLRADKFDRRQLIQFHDRKSGSPDLSPESKDVCCNLMLVPRIRVGDEDDILDITVFNRSNDLMWGMFGANAVQFATIQQYLAAALDIQVGNYTQVSTNAHAYLDFGPWSKMSKSLESNHISFGDPYPGTRTLMFNGTSPFAQDDFWTDVNRFFSDWRIIDESYSHQFKTNWFRNVVLPMYLVNHNLKRGNISDARIRASHIAAPDWKVAAVQFVNRKQVD